jgi:hypothetical protein
MEQLLQVTRMVGLIKAVWNVKGEKPTIKQRIRISHYKFCNEILL